MIQVKIGQTSRIFNDKLDAITFILQEDVYLDTLRQSIAQDKAGIYVKRNLK